MEKTIGQKVNDTVTGAMDDATYSLVRAFERIGKLGEKVHTTVVPIHTTPYDVGQSIKNFFTK